MTVKNFEDLNVWKDAKSMVVAIYKATSTKILPDSSDIQKDRQEK
jgi:hypothetical protein